MILAFLLLASSQAFAVEPGFRSGNEYQSVKLTGEVLAYCRNSIGAPIGPYRYACVGNALDPVEFDRFVADVDADQVLLNAVHEDGSTRDKTVSFNASKGESQRVNLWIRTLLQRPLLETGTNRIQYTFKKRGEIVLQGETRVLVGTGTERRCHDRVINLPNGTDCRHSSQVCDAYFRQEDYCH